MANREDLGLVIGAARVRVVRGRRAIVIESKHLARVTVRILRAAAVAAARRRHVELAVTAPREPRGSAHTGPTTEDVFELGNYRAVESPTRERQRRLFLVDALEICEVDEVIRRELWMQRHVHQSGPPLHADGRGTGHGL